MIKKWEERYEVSSYECRSCHSGESLAVAQAKDEEIAELRAYVAKHMLEDVMRYIYVVYGVSHIEGEGVTTIVKAFHTCASAELFAEEMIEDADYGYSDYGISALEIE